ncbi:hypothetical protein GCM10011613_13010 [Cellvibrio zantedeschiae]|uniref:Uncharacterized protein n=1 Tax=Cellvibrio zantedeschiae TaxID=1237077 RepID=A0ABQ3AWJ6_9GAMM|nr:hypothetical protein GCM10011613_13010 [Cellvibrio zantedeschiae]
MSPNVYFLVTDLSSRADSFSFRNRFGKGFRFLTAFEIQPNLRERCFMQDYIEDLLDDVEEFDDDIADDYSDI